MTPEDRIRAAVRPYDGLDDEAGRLASDTIRRLSWRRTRAGKRCPVCETARPLADFGPDIWRPDGLARVCRECRRETERAPARAPLTHCPKGHEYTEANTSVRRGVKECRACNAARARARYRANRLQ